MSSNPAALFERVSSSFSKLSSAAKDLNSVSDELGRAISAIDVVLQHLNLGVPSWVAVTSGGDPWTYWSRDIGYAKIGGRWGISLRTREGTEGDPEDDKIESWLFNDAPRWMRVEAVEKIPDLMEQLTKDAEATTKRLRGKIDHAKQLADAFKQAARAPGENPAQQAARAETAIAEIERTYGKLKERAPLIVQPSVVAPVGKNKK